MIYIGDDHLIEKRAANSDRRNGRADATGADDKNTHDKAFLSRRTLTGQFCYNRISRLY